MRLGLFIYPKHPITRTFPGLFLRLTSLRPANNSTALPRRTRLVRQKTISRKKCGLLGVLGITALFAGVSFAVSATGQVIAQTPRPEIPAHQQDEIVETLKSPARIGHSGTVIQIPRAGALLFASFDANGDYIIDRTEVEAGILQAFERADRDGDDYLSLVELEMWRIAALGSEHAAPSNFAFAPNFARGVTQKMFVQVLQRLAERLDKDDQSKMDGKIALADLLKDYRPVRHRQQDNCFDKIREERRRAEQNCRNGRR